MKFPAFTITEILIVLVLSGIVISMAQFSFLSIGKLQAGYMAMENDAEDHMQLTYLLESDFFHAYEITLQGELLQFQYFDNSEISYSTKEDYIYREQGSLTDTFKYEDLIWRPQMAMSAKEGNLIKGLDLQFSYQEQQYHLLYDKHYDARTLLQLEGRVYGY